MFNYKYRKCPRLKGYNYSQPGYYFVTICVKNKFCYFGKVADKIMILNKFGRMVKNCWQELPIYYKNCVLDEFIIMPNHFHGIIKITVGADFKSTRTNDDFKLPTLSSIIQGFKIFSSRKIHANAGSELIYHFYWQRSFYDSIITNFYSLSRIRQYIKDNPKKWHLDNYNIH